MLFKNPGFCVQLLGRSSNDRPIQGLIGGVVGGLLVYWVRMITYGKYRELSAEDVASISPQLAWIKWGYPALQVLCIAVAVPTFVGLDSWLNHGRPTNPLLLGLIFGSYAIVEGYVAARTGVYIANNKLRLRFYYANDLRLKRLGKIQMSIGLVVCSGLAFAIYVAPLLQT